VPFVSAIVTKVTLADGTADGAVDIDPPEGLLNLA
jgi:hypothetical protein